MSPAASPALADALLAARLCARDPGLGGLLLRGADPLRDRVIAELTSAMPAGAPIRRVPVNADAEALDGGIDLAAILAGEGIRKVSGLLERAVGGLLIAPMADRLSSEAAGRIAAGLDRRQGFMVAALDDGDEGAGVPAAVTERLAFWIDLDRSSGAAYESAEDASAEPVALEDAMATLAGVAAALGVASSRASLLALRAARVAAASAGRSALTEVDIAAAVRLVLAPRATRPPVMDDGAEDADTSQPRPGGDATELTSKPASDALVEHVLAAARAAIDPDLLAGLDPGKRTIREGRVARAAGERRRARTRGRRAGTRPGMPTGGARLALVETLRAAAPWQPARGRTTRVLLRRSDLRVHRFEARSGLLTIFSVDASGSTAMARLAEAKGAVELLLSQAYIQRAEVALIAFRRTAAELILPPTRSLTRARRLLAELPGGGGTPLAGGIAAAHALGLSARARGLTPALVLLSDGRANVAADGSGGRSEAERDALAAARALAADGIAAIFVDTSARPRAEGARLAAALRADYRPLPYADAAAIGSAIKARPA